MNKNLITHAATDNPPPPPPPFPSASASKLSRKTLIAAIVIVIVVIAVVAGVYLATNRPNTSSNTSPNANPSNSPGSNPNVAEASSLKFTVSYTATDTDDSFTYTYSAKNIGQSNMMIRIEGNSAEEGDAVIILNGAKQKAWTYSDGEWTDISIIYETYWDTWKNMFSSYEDSLESWSGAGDWSYSYQGGTVRLYNVEVNPVLADSMFER